MCPPENLLLTEAHASDMIRFVQCFAGPLLAQRPFLFQLASSGPFRASNRAISQPHSINRLTSDMRNLLLPPIDTIFGSLPDDTNLHIVRGDSDSIAASSFAEIAIARLSVVVRCSNPFSMANLLFGCHQLTINS